MSRRLRALLLLALLTLQACGLATSQAKEDALPPASPALVEVQLLAAAASPGGGGSGSDGPSADTPAGTGKGKCSPTLQEVARTLPDLRQLVKLADAGFNIFAADGGKPCTVLAPSNQALKLLAEGVADEDRQAMLDGFYSIILYHQIPDGAYPLSQLVLLGNLGLQTTLGKSLNKPYEVTFDNSTNPVVVTGGWPANNAPLLSSHSACNGWLHVVDNVLLPTPKFSNLPRLVDDAPDLESNLMPLLLGGNASAPAGTPPPPGQRANTAGAAGEVAGDGTATADGAEDGAGSVGHHSNATNIVISSGARPGRPAAAVQAAAPADGNSEEESSSSDNKVLVIAASAAGAAVAVSAAVVAAVLLRKHAYRRRKQQQSVAGRLEAEAAAAAAYGGGGSPKASKSKPLRVHVEA